MSTAMFAVVSESAEVIPGAAVVAVVRSIVQPAPGLMEVVELEAVDSCDIDPKNQGSQIKYVQQEVPTTVGLHPWSNEST